MKVLTVDDDRLVRTSFRRNLHESHDLVEAVDYVEATSALENDSFDLIFLDLKLGKTEELDGKKLISLSREENPTATIVVMTGQEDLDLVDECFELGADDYLFKPIIWNQLGKIIYKANRLSSLKRQNIALKPRSRISTEKKFQTQSPVFKKILDTVEKLQGKKISTLITGENGVGKEEIARYIWSLENDPDRPFVAVNCSAINANLIESELFGHKKGAFTGATQNGVGKFEQADGGDIFLDEIGTMPMDLQVKLLRTLNDGEITPVGSDKSKKLSFRVISATNEDLPKLVKEGRFRQDLYYRIKQLELNIPPLRSRVEDIPTLCRNILDSIGFSDKSLNQEAISFLESYEWPGNVRELRNALEVASELSDGNEISKEEIVAHLEKAEPGSTLPKGELLQVPIPFRGYSQRVRRFEQHLVESVLHEKGSVNAAAKHLGISRNTLSSKLKNWGWKSDLVQ